MAFIKLCFIAVVMTTNSCFAFSLNHAPFPDYEKYRYEDVDSKRSENILEHEENHFAYVCCPGGCCVVV